MKKSAAGSFFLAVFSLLGSSHAAVQPYDVNSELCAVSNTTFVARSHLRRAPNSFAQLDPGATVSDACASYADLDRLNVRLHPYIHNLVTKTDFFSYYRLNLYNKVCPFWSDENGLCGNIACMVTTLEKEDDIPPVWRAQELSRLEGPKAHHPDKKERQEHPDKPLLGELGEGVGESCVVEYDDECDERDYCVPEDESAGAKGDYVSLVDNPERFTGYAGEGAHQVWEAIYRENCFSKPSARQDGLGIPGVQAPLGGLAGQQARAAQDFRSVMQEHGRQALQAGASDDGMEFEEECLEKRVFYRVISGMHASISAHLCYDYLNQTTGEWGPNLACYKRRLDSHPERISNLYFNYALVLRAVGKLEDFVQDYTFCTGDPVEDRKTKKLITTLAKALPAGPEIFDESVMFRDDDPSNKGITLKEDFRNRFRNVSRIMDCVGCDKCRLWGKLQTAGYGTALKVLFELGDDDAGKAKALLRRTELVALINTLDKLSHALEAVGEFRKMMDSEKPAVESIVAPGAESDEELYESDNGECKPAPDQTIKEIFWEEWDKIWTMYFYVLRSWISFPGTALTILLSELDRLYSYWIGLPVRPRTWEIRMPNRDEL